MSRSVYRELSNIILHQDGLRIIKSFNSDKIESIFRRIDPLTKGVKLHKGHILHISNEDKKLFSISQFTHLYINWLFNTKFISDLEDSISEDNLILREKQLDRVKSKLLKFREFLVEDNEFNKICLPILERFEFDVFPKTFPSIKNKKTKTKNNRSLEIKKQYQQGRWLDVIHRYLLKKKFIHQDNGVADFYAVFYRNESVKIKWLGNHKILAAFLDSISNILKRKSGYLIRVTEIFVDADGKALVYSSINSARKSLHKDKDVISFTENILNINIPAH